MNDWTNLKCKKLYCGGCSGDERLQKLLDGQSNNTYTIYDLQMTRDPGSDYAWIFYQGDIPEDA